MFGGLINWVQHPFRSLFFSVLLLFVCMAVFNVMGTVIFTPVKTVTDITKKTLDADNLIYNYEWFKTQFSEIKAFRVKYKNAEEALTFYETSLKDLPRKEWSFDQNQRWNELSAQVLGLKNQCADMVATYNARSKMANRTLVKFDGNLPENIESC